jgi:hypothetical protein
VPHRERALKLGPLDIIYPNSYFKPLLDPGGGFRIETAVTWLFYLEAKWLLIQIYSGYIYI